MSRHSRRKMVTVYPDISSTMFITREARPRTGAPEGQAFSRGPGDSHLDHTDAENLPSWTCSDPSRSSRSPSRGSRTVMQPGFPWPQATSTSAELQEVAALGEGLRKQRQAHIIPVIDVRVRVIKFFVHVPNPPVLELLVEDARAPNEVVLILRPAIDVDEPQPTQPRRVPIDHIHGIPAPPAGPHLGPPLACVKVEREINSELLALRIRRIVRGHADRVQHRLHFFQAPVRLPPEPTEPFRRATVLPKRRKRLREIHYVAVLEEGVPRVIREGGPGVRVKHPLDDGSDSPGDLPPNPPPEEAELRLT